MKIGLRILLIVVIQSIALVVMVGMKQYTLLTGVPVVLQTRPIDPRSLFRGDYVRLNYYINDLTLEKLAGDKQFRREQTVYVLLKQTGQYWEASAVYHDMPALAAGEVAIKGRVQYAYSSRYDRNGKVTPITHRMNVKYGVENYFVQEHSGHELERPGRDNVVSIQLAVDKHGNAAIQAVLINGKIRYRESVF